MKKSGNILIVDDNRGVLTALQLLLKPYFDKITTLSSPVTLPGTLREDTWKVVLLDMNFTSGINTGNEGLYWLHEIKKQYPSLPVVLFTAYADIDLAVRGIKEGATDFVVKPWDNGKLVETLLNAAQDTPTSGKKKATAATAVSSMYWGESSAMQQLRMLVEKVAVTDANILITGENGTGKEMLAREIHALSTRHHKEMISVDMGAITESLFESELFGHMKGSFTDAHADRPGKFESADHSTLFLDEIGNLPYHLQAKLLTALQRRSIVRVGSNTPIPSTYDWFVPPTATYLKWRIKESFARTCSTASIPFILKFLHCENGRKILFHWQNASSHASASNMESLLCVWTIQHVRS